MQTPNFQFINLLNHTIPFEKQKKTSNFLILNQTKKIANFPIDSSDNRHCWIGPSSIYKI